MQNFDQHDVVLQHINSPKDSSVGFKMPTNQTDTNNALSTYDRLTSPIYNIKNPNQLMNTQKNFSNLMIIPNNYSEQRQSPVFQKLEKMKSSDEQNNDQFGKETLDLEPSVMAKNSPSPATPDENESVLRNSNNS